MSFLKGFFGKAKEETNVRPPAPNEFTPHQEESKVSQPVANSNMFSGMAVKPRVKPHEQVQEIEEKPKVLDLLI